MKKLKKQYTHILLLTGFLALIDQISKWYAFNNFQKPHIIIPNALSLTYSENTGIAWSIPIPNFIMLILIPIMIIGGGWAASQHFNIGKKISQITLGLILGGAIGNYIDRAISGKVVDFISMGSYPVYNLADVFITIGVFLIIIFYGKIIRSTN